MSDTPRTDAEILHYKANAGGLRETVKFEGASIVKANFARTLERELSSEKSKVAALDDMLDAMIRAEKEEAMEDVELRAELSEWRACAEKLADALNQPARRPRHSGLCCKTGPDGQFISDAAGHLVIDCACGDCAKQAFDALAEFDRLKGAK